MSATELHRCKAIVRPELPQNTVDVVLDGLLGKVEIGRDLLVAQSQTDQLNELLLTSAEAEALAAVVDRKIERLPGYVFKERETQVGRAHSTLIRHDADGLGYFHGRCVFQDVTRDSSSNTA